MLLTTLCDGPEVHRHSPMTGLTGLFVQQVTGRRVCVQRQRGPAWLAARVGRQVFETSTVAPAPYVGASRPGWNHWRRAACSTAEKAGRG